MKTNIWKIVSVLLISLIIILSFILYSDYSKTYDLGTFKVKKTTIDNIAEEIGNRFTICDIEQDKCVGFGKIGA